MKRTILLLITGLLANAVILMLAWQVRRLSEELQAERGAHAQDRARLDAALGLVDDAVKAVGAIDAARAGALGVRAGVVRSGDLRVLETPPHHDMVLLFNEML